MSVFHSRNDRAPNNYKRKFSISAHALERFRERVDDDFRARPDADLGNLLDEKLQQSTEQYTVRDPRAPEEVTQLYKIGTRQDETFYVVVRNKTAVTVLDPVMAQKNFQGAWKPTLNTPFNADSLKSVMKAIQLAPPQPPPQPALPSRSPELSPLEQAGLAYARALGRKREAEQRSVETKKLAEQAQKAAAEAESDLQIASAECAAAMEALTALAEEP